MRCSARITSSNGAVMRGCRGVCCTREGAELGRGRERRRRRRRQDVSGGRRRETRMAGGEEHGRTRRRGGGEEKEGAERITEMVRTPLQDAGRGRGMCEGRRKVQQDVSGADGGRHGCWGAQSTDGRGEMEEGKRRRGRGSSRRQGTEPRSTMRSWTARVSHGWLPPPAPANAPLGAKVKAKRWRAYSRPGWRDRHRSWTSTRPTVSAMYCGWW